MGGEELKWHQLTHQQLMSPQGHHYSPNSAAKTNNKSTNLTEEWYLLVPFHQTNFLAYHLSLSGMHEFHSLLGYCSHVGVVN